ncbi:hypothetical protein [Alsobacter soli]|uniref:hypothetical protein n=1 Tax=Alsobacter soli TaxID=2109933 RepID=UPI001304CE74|nr:hypothetical protein [Alsobacter soli]
MSDSTDKAMLLHMAEMWLDLARTRERGELIGAGPDIPNEDSVTAPRITHSPEDR